ncbi:hypothetical protein J7355_13435 [Endozoicomonas sp. G2_2]|uniref:hypothetical protein n=1 Tax=Endozoicomonas sp. G2_2 TaxID=2821092 RepID=UPI001ADD578B|nr:hypothetical protein [Endozoicomonas sp. G2_2]MBO9471098.1 hypothetical protein [Endozoicomonas sp. G2_2]
MKKLSIAAALVVASVCTGAQAKTELMTRHQAGLYGTELYSIGEYDLALTYLRAAVFSRVERLDAIPSLELSDPGHPPEGYDDFARTLAEVYWEMGDGPSAVYVARTLIRNPTYALWRCKRAEQQLMLDYAYDCYTAIQDHDRARRVMRQQAAFPGN